MADALIGALAARHDGIITRDGAHFRSLYPRLRIVDPSPDSARSRLDPEGRRTGSTTAASRKPVTEKAAVVAACGR